MSQQYTLIGHPLGHSMSPMIHTALFGLSGRDAVYDLTDIAPEDLEHAMSQLRQLAGFNITIPYKQQILPFLDALGDSAKRYGAVNCVVKDGGKLIGYNTDCDGFLQSVATFPLDGNVLLVGCGGAGRMMAMEAALHGARVTLGILPRHVKKAAALAEEILAAKPDAVVRIALTETLDEPFDVLLNATPVGMYPHGDACPVQDTLLAQCACVFDAIYNPVETLLVKKARCFGKTAVGGSAMLVGQAVKAHALWNQDSYSASQVQEIVSRLEQEVAARFPAAGGASA